ncbi:MAG: sigma-70 family RNA polymerase sigma factor [Clostridia bacterium]|nr:sigma-70 family RNA polymerase sigma factor [Clostridia bacterium]
MVGEFSTETDEALVALAADGNEAACDALTERYTPLVRYLARPYFLAGGDAEDLVQEGLIGFVKAMRTYEEEKNDSFRAYASACIKSKLLSALRKSLSKKQLPLNDYISLEAPFFDEFVALQGDPVENVIDAEDLLELSQTLSGILSAHEAKILHLYLEGRSYQEISSITGKSQKSVDNAIQRIRRKLAGTGKHRA